MKVQCPDCTQRYMIEDDMETVDCVNCGRTFPARLNIIPSAPEPTPPPLTVNRSENRTPIQHQGKKVSYAALFAVLLLFSNLAFVFLCWSFDKSNAALRAELAELKGETENMTPTAALQSLSENGLTADAEATTPSPANDAQKTPTPSTGGTSTVTKTPPTSGIVELTFEESDFNSEPDIMKTTWITYKDAESLKSESNGTAFTFSPYIGKFDDGKLTLHLHAQYAEPSAQAMLADIQSFKFSGGGADVIFDIADDRKSGVGSGTRWESVDLDISDKASELAKVAQAAAISVEAQTADKRTVFTLTPEQLKMFRSVMAKYQSLAK